MNCQWKYEDCKFEGTTKCDNCFTEGLLYKEKPNKKRNTLARHQQKADKRMGSQFEYANHKRNESRMKEATSSMTLNSGATVFEKADEHIGGYVKVAEELKTQMPERARGTKTFTIQRKWLDKLNSESKKEGQDFWYLKFAFSETEGMNPAGNVFVVAEEKVFMDMVASMQQDRAAAALCGKRIEVMSRQKDMVQAQLNAAMAKIAYYEAQESLMHAIEEQEKKEREIGKGKDTGSAEAGR